MGIDGVYVDAMGRQVAGKVAEPMWRELPLEVITLDHSGIPTVPVVSGSCQTR